MGIDNYYNSDKRKTNIRLAYDGNPNGYQWLTKREVEIAGLLKLSVHRPRHGDDNNNTECPTPRVCGYIMYKQDYERIKAVLKIEKDAKKHRK